jgi:hypothetical protein
MTAPNRTGRNLRSELRGVSLTSCIERSNSALHHPGLGWHRHLLLPVPLTVPVGTNGPSVANTLSGVWDSNPPLSESLRSALPMKLAPSPHRNLFAEGTTGPSATRAACRVVLLRTTVYTARPCLAISATAACATGGIRTRNRLSEVARASTTLQSPCGGNRRLAL